MGTVGDVGNDGLYAVSVSSADGSIIWKAGVQAFEEDEALRRVAGDLATELAADAPACAGDEHNTSFQHLADVFCEFDVVAAVESRTSTRNWLTRLPERELVQ
jgi:hypothetical protein